MTRSLMNDPPFLPAKLHYDERGSELFEEICEQPEYGLTRTEAGIMRDNAAAIADAIGPDAAVIEPGSGASIKTELLIDALDRCAGYIPSDISDTMLAHASERFADRFPGLPIRPLHADFMQPIRLPDDSQLGTRRVVYFPGSTIGNFGPAAQRQVMKSFKTLAGDSGCLLVGFDLVKPVTLMERAYNDAAGVTAAFNLNMIDRLQRDFGLDFQSEDFEFDARWNPERQAVVSHVRAVTDIAVEIGNHTFTLRKGGTIRTEESHKYTGDRIAALAESCGLVVSEQWHDGDEGFAVVMLSPE
ncbi:MAG: L-histidine N(alpha)-methyltransferase [Planctomycetota bacterium]